MISIVDFGAPDLARVATAFNCNCPAIRTTAASNLCSPMAVVTKAKPKKQPQSKDEIARALQHYKALRWFAVISMLAIASWIVIALFGPVPKYELTQRIA